MIKPFKGKKVTLEGGFGLKYVKIPQGLRDEFGQPPFSILDARQGLWQSRKKKWQSFGLQSEIGREDNLLKFSEKTKLKKKNYRITITDEKFKGEPTASTSTFDPVLCELMYNWFCPIDGNALDPFCGGCVRGIIAGYLGYEYIGFDLREEQVESNELQLKYINQIGCISPIPKWICDDALNMNRHTEEQEFDFVFSCPPYGNLEVYNDDPRDLSNKNYETFLESYDEIILKACQKLKNNRFACFVVANFRDKTNGMFNDFVGDTIYAFKKAGLHFYNDIVLITAIGNLQIRVGRQFRNYRKIGKTHQNVLVFYKGDNQKEIKNLKFATDKEEEK